MFDLDDYGDFHWYNLFIILSLEKANACLPAIGFPLDHKSSELEQIAKSLVVSYHEIQLQRYAPGQKASEIREVFSRTYDTLVDELGREATDAICEWGNQLHLSGDLHYSLFLFEELFFGLDQADSTSDLTLPALLPEVLGRLKSIIRPYREKARDIDVALDELDQLTANGWEKQAISFVNEAHQPYGEPPIRLYDELWTLIGDVEIQHMLKAIERQLSRENLATLERWIESQPSWIRHQTSPFKPAYRAYRLSELLDQIRDSEY